MSKDLFYINNNKTVPLEFEVKRCRDFDEFEKMFSDELLNEDNRIGNYLSDLLWKYDKKASVVSVDALLAPAYVGNIINGKKNNPSRDTLIRICFALGASFEEMQYLLKYAGHAPLYVRKKRDVVIWFGLIKGESLDVVNENLLSRNLRPLYSE